MRRRLAYLALACAVLLTFSKSVLVKATFESVPLATQTADKDDPSKGSGDIDKTIEYPMAQVLGAVKQAFITYGCDIESKKEKPDYLECTRSRHFGAFVGSGGEKITVRLSPKGTETRVVIETGKGFAGRLGKKNWSTPVYNEMMKTLKGS
jgi:hypothetical protein